MTWRELYNDACSRLASISEARWLVEEAAPGTWPALLSERVTERGRTFLNHLLRRRLDGEPLQYVLGHWAFRALDLMVDPRVLIPRPETEVLVDVALDELDRQAPARPVVVDLGTGSGAVALSVAAERPGSEVWATDVSEEALKVAGANTAGLGMTGVRLAAGVWWGALPPALRGAVHLAVSNPPYVSSGEMAALEEVVAAWEPRCALEAGPTGLEAVSEILAGAGEWLAPGGAVVVEIGSHHAGRAEGLAACHGLVDVRTHRDLAGRHRVLSARVSRRSAG